MIRLHQRPMKVLRLDDRLSVLLALRKQQAATWRAPGGRELGPRRTSFAGGMSGLMDMRRYLTQF